MKFAYVLRWIATILLSPLFVITLIGLFMLGLIWGDGNVYMDQYGTITFSKDEEE